MQSGFTLLLVSSLAALACTGADAPADRSSTDGQVGKSGTQSAVIAKLSLPCDGGTFAKFRLQNIGARSYQRDSFSDRCDLTDQAAGVIWVATGEGHALADAEQKLVFKDERGRQLGHTCWTRSGTINDVTLTEVVLYGPQDSKKITVCCGAACADAEIGQPSKAR